MQNSCVWWNETDTVLLVSFPDVLLVLFLRPGLGMSLDTTVTLIIDTNTKCYCYHYSIKQCIYKYSVIQVLQEVWRESSIHHIAW